MDSKHINKILGPMYENIARDGRQILQELGLPKDAKILDVGTGGGNFAIFLATQGFQVLTGEPKSDQSPYAKQDWASKAEVLGVHDKIRFESFDASQMPYQSHQFDAVFFFGVLHHIDEELRERVVQEALRVTKNRGAVVFGEPNRETLSIVRKKNSDHPPAANPSHYTRGLNTLETKLNGVLMDMFIYRHAAA